MQQIFLNNDAVDGVFKVTGDDAFHLLKVVRLSVAEKLRVSTASEHNYICEVTSCDKESLECRIIEEVASTELDNRIYLFCALPKGDRLETIIEKAVELGVYEIIPMEMQNCVVKLDDKKKESRLKRYRSICESAAKQSKRSRVPEIHDIISYKQALEYAKDIDNKLLCYESKNGMADTVEALDAIKAGDSIGIIIGPEGGIAPKELDEACDNNFKIISLGSRILRTDTAAITAMALCMYKCELL